MYHPETGRFLSEDPLGFDAEDTNLYRYVLNNPISFTDPTGEKVYVGKRDAVPPLPGKHTAIILKPDNMHSFRNHDLFKKFGDFAILSGLPDGPENKCSSFFGSLRFAPNLPEDRPLNLDSNSLNRDTKNGKPDLREVRRPAGKSDTQFIQDLIAAAKRYKNNAPYHPEATGRRLYRTGRPVVQMYNSNSFVSGVIRAAGGVRPALPGSNWIPGYDKPLPIPFNPDRLCACLEPGQTIS